MMTDAILCKFCERPVTYVRFVSREMSGYQCLRCGVSFGPEVTANWGWGIYFGRTATMLLSYCRLPWHRLTA